MDAGTVGALPEDFLKVPDALVGGVQTLFLEADDLSELRDLLGLFLVGDGGQDGDTGVGFAAARPGGAAAGRTLDDFGHGGIIARPDFA